MPSQRQITHTGFVVPDLDAALEWYREVFGFEPMLPPGEIRRGEGHFGQLAEDIWGSDWTSVRSALIGTESAGILELISYPDTEEAEEWRVRRPGWNHVCLVDPDIEQLVERIVSSGGKQRSKIWTLFEEKPYKVVFVEDPWGTVIEVSTHTTEVTYGGAELKG